MKNNTVQLIGYVADSAKITVSRDGVKRALIRVATHDKIQNPNSENKYNTIWHEVIAWDETADEAENSFVKGSQILVSGMLVYRKYIDKNGQMHKLVDIKAEYLRNLDR